MCVCWAFSWVYSIKKSNVPFIREKTGNFFLCVWFGYKNSKKLSKPVANTFFWPHHFAFFPLTMSTLQLRLATYWFCAIFFARAFSVHIFHASFKINRERMPKKGRIAEWHSPSPPLLRFFVIFYPLMAQFAYPKV